jgi:putative glutamine amidotransferase
VPVLLPHESALIERYVAMCDGLILTGGSDPNTAAFGEAVHPKARVMDPQRQAFEVGLLETWARVKPQAAVLGVCLGMQLMALHAEGQLDQYLPETLDDPSVHQEYKRHAIDICVTDSVLADAAAQTVVSSHQQAVADAGTMRVIARATDGVIEAIDDPGKKFYVGVQWHPERGGDQLLSQGLIAQLVQAAGLCTS